MSHSNLGEPPKKSVDPLNPCAPRAIPDIDGDDHVFMNMASFEEERIATANLDKAEFITEAMELTVLYYKGLTLP